MRTTFFVLIGGFLGGVACRSFGAIDIPTQASLLVGAVCLFLVGYFVIHDKVSLYSSLFILALLLGVYRTEYAFSEYRKGYVLTPEEVFSGLGTVIQEPDMRDTHTILYVRLETGREDTETNVRIKAPQYPPIVYGERVMVQGAVHVPESFKTETGRVFNYEGYLMKDHVQYELRDASVVSTGTFTASSFMSFLLSLKHAWLASISRNLNEPNASLAGGVIVGAKQSLGEKWLGAFRDTGIIHIVVLSGYNLTLVSNSIVRGTAFLPQAIRLSCGVFGIISFAIMVGGGATVVRASVMAVLGMLVGFVNRPHALLRALFLAALVMVFWNPFVLMFDSGFQLSFMATLGLIVMAPILEKKFTLVPVSSGFRGIVAGTVATQLAVLPLLLYHIGVVSLIAPVVNMLVLPVVPTVMLIGFLTGVVGIWSTVLALPFSLVSNLLLSYIFTTVKIFASFPYASITVDALPWWSLILLYSVFPLWYFVYKIKITRSLC